jgi:hypothetical protein
LDKDLATILTLILKLFPKSFINILFVENIMQSIVIGVVIIFTVLVVIFGIIYCFWCKKNGQLQKEDFSFDEIYHYQEAR